MALASCDDSAVESSSGSPAPRLSASLTEDAPGATTYTARVLVENPAPDEYLALSVTADAGISFLGSTPSSTYCSRAGAELTFAIVSAPSTPVLTIALMKAALPGVAAADAARDSDDGAMDASASDMDAFDADASDAQSSIADAAAASPASDASGPTPGPNASCAGPELIVEEQLVVTVPSAPSPGTSSDGSPDATISPDASNDAANDGDSTDDASSDASAENEGGSAGDAASDASQGDASESDAQPPPDAGDASTD